MAAFLVFFLLALSVAATIGFVLFIGQRRTQNMQAVAQDLNFLFYPKGNDRLSPLLANLDFFSRGKYKRITNLMMGNLPKIGGRGSVAIFDYSFTIGPKGNTETFCQSVILFFVEGMTLPRFSLRLEHIVNKLGTMLGFRDIHFPACSQFSQKYRLTSDQEIGVRSIFQPAVLEFLKDEFFCAEAEGSYLAIYPAGDNNLKKRQIYIHNGQDYAESGFLPPEAIPLFLETGILFLNLLQEN
jgi:hypothetical protein